MFGKGVGEQNVWGGMLVSRAQTNSLPLAQHDRKALSRRVETRRRHIRVYDVSYTSPLIASGAISRDTWGSQMLQQTARAINWRMDV